MTKADKHREAWYKMRGFPYMWGYESNPAGVPDPVFDVGDPVGSDPRKGDCSGDVWAALRYAEAYLNGRPITKGDRRTARGWAAIATPIDQPSKPGDMGFLGSPEYHMFAYLGNGEVGEMGYNHEARITTVAVENARPGIHWGRVNLDLGELSSEPILVTHRALWQGCRGIEVQLLQNLLNKAGWQPPLIPDGVFGRTTRKAVVWLQLKSGLQGLGVVGPKTWAILDELE